MTKSSQRYLLLFTSLLLLLVSIAGRVQQVYSSSNKPDIIPYCVNFLSTDCLPSTLRADHQSLIVEEYNAFRQLADTSLGSSGIKEAEMAASDTMVLVWISDLTEKDRLGAQLLDFINDARETERALQMFRSKVRGTVDGYA